MNHRIFYFLEPDSILREIDIHFANLMKEFSNGSQEIFIASCLVSRATGEGHVCLDLSEVADKQIELFFSPSNRYELIKCPKLDIWRSKLFNSGVVGEPGDYKPLILDNKNRLYLYRYWKYERILIEELLKRAFRKNTILNTNKLTEIKNALFHIFSPDKKLDFQILSALIPITRNICIISGGPGTGKTTTVVKILAFLLMCLKKGLKIFLAAPTGKASTRLRQAVSEVKVNLSIDKDLKNFIPDDTYTIHRMLTPIHGTPYFKYNAENKLLVDILVVDEASMIDLPLMSKLLQAIPNDSILIILGDKNQLSSVEPGSVLGDMCAGSNGIPYDTLELFYKLTGRDKNSFSEISIKSKSFINNCIIELKKNYRFSKKSGIFILSRAIQRGDIHKVYNILEKGQYSDVLFKRLPKPNFLTAYLRDIVLREYRDYICSKDPFETIKKFESFRILCPVKWGNYGVKHINKIVEDILHKEGLINKHELWYIGRPIMITKNSYELQLFNGDVGIIMSDPDSNYEARAFFIDLNGGGIRKFLPIMLPDHETVYAMTVHKSQGSEFEDVLLILPDIYVPVITRELLYTAITRVKVSVEIWGTIEVIEKGISQCIKRSSGLKDALWDI